ncbi:unnamed protein product [Hermetia illucens]|uniref:Uncharacterized protein n=1 Tax=Hermetia illucens TaxID=343691 RepID=A0A7R8V7M1_HERIL|nr:unnamed protein product [Hermetia illucens]
MGVTAAPSADIIENGKESVKSEHRNLNAILPRNRAIDEHSECKWHSIRPQTKSTLKYMKIAWDFGEKVGEKMVTKKDVAILRNCNDMENKSWPNNPFRGNNVRQA